MLKKGPLGKVEKFHIENHYLTISASEMASDLNRPKAAVENHIKKYVKNGKPVGSTIGEQMARRPGVVTMTENASTMSDSKRKPGKTVSKNCVTKIKND